MSTVSRWLEDFLRSFAGQSAGLIALVALIYFVVWRWGARRFKGARIHTKRKADGRQIRGELAHTFVALAVGAATATAVTLLYKAGYTKLSNDAGRWSTLEISLLAFGLVVFNDAWFYGWHRILHHPRVFQRVHAVHHRSIDVNPFTSYSFHALEATVISLWVVPMVLVVPIYFPVFGIVQVIGTANNVMSHLGYEFLPRWLLRVPGLRWMNSATFHSLHHTEICGNYGLFFRFWDRLLGTELPGYEQAFLERGRPVPSATVLRARVTKIVAESPSTTSLSLQPIGSPVTARPGQFFVVRWKGASRSYSVSHPDELRLTIKRVPDGLVSGALIQGAYIGAELELKGPFGTFGRDIPASGRVLFLAGGSGVTPFGSLAPAAARQGLSARVVIINKSSRDAPLVTELSAVPKLDVVTHHDDEHGVLDEGTLVSLLGPRPVGVWICGPLPLIALMKRVLSARWPGLPVREEQFVAGRSAFDEPRRVHIVTANSRLSVMVNPGASILEAARAASVELPAGCEQGACGSCRVRVLEGRVDTPASSCLTDDERRRGLALACVGAPSEDAVIEPLDSADFSQ
jgi:sterol desaturase/sphingolipid hydroxylase (fatty acid hydroxylase superfamily)/ferredoxin-NADP reductase